MHLCVGSPDVEFYNVLDCLWNNYDEGKLSPLCDTTLNQMENILGSRPQYGSDVDTESLHEDEIEIDTMVVLSMVTTPLFLILIFASIIMRRRRAHRCARLNPEKRRLRSAVLNAVYENEEIKTKVQEVVEMDLGDEVPLPHHLGDEATVSPPPEGNKCMILLDRCVLSLPLMSLTALLIYTSVTSPGAVLAIGGPSIAIMLGYVVLKSFCRCMYACFCSERDDGNTDFELQGREALIVESGGNDTGVCHNCDVPSMSNCGSCGCCVNCCNCGAEEGKPLIMML